MPTSGEPDASAGRWAVDTSVAVAYLDAGHSAHDACVAAVGGRRPALAGHAVFETFSALTRLPGDARVLAADAVEAIGAAFPEPCWLAPEEHAALLRRLGTSGVRGGAAYDALVGESARVHERLLLTRDRRAVRTYDAIGARYQVVD